MSAQIRVEGNTPRLLEKGDAAPPMSGVDPNAELEAGQQRYWTSDKAQHVVAQIMRAASKFYGPSVKAAEWELELIGDPAAAVMNDWMPLRLGQTGDKTANLIALAVVAGIIIALRIPDILEVHGIIKPKYSERPAEPTAPPQAQQPAAAAPATTPPAVPDIFEPQLVGGSERVVVDDDRRRQELFGAQQVGARGSFTGEPA